MEEQEGDEPAPVAGRRAARRQPHHETRTERLDQCINTLTELVNTLLAMLGQNTANVAPVIPLWIPLANAEGKEVPPPQKGREAMANEAQPDTHTRRRHIWRRRHNATRERHKNRETTLESHETEHTRDSVINRLERIVDDPNLDDKYDSEYERSTGSRESADLRARLDARRAWCQQQAENRPLV